MQVSIRDATASDAPRVALLLAELGYPASSSFAAQRLAQFDSDVSSRVQVAEASGEVVGLVATHIVPRLDTDLLSCRIVDMVVASEHRRCSIGSRLVDAAEAEARRHGSRRLDLSSGDWRGDAHVFYGTLGFETRSRGFVKRLAP